MVIGDLRQEMLVTESADERTSSPVDCCGYPYVTIWIAGAGTISGGVVTIEAAFIKPTLLAQGYSGTWDEITTYTVTPLSGGAQIGISLTPASYAYIRTRISTAVSGGGTISTYLTAA